MKKTSAKILALLLALMLSLSALAVTASAAAPAFSISNKSVAVGSTVVVEISLSANSNAGSGDFVLKYDNAKLTPTKAVAGDLLTDAGASLTRNLTYSANSIKCAFAGAEALTDGGVLAKITFEGKAAGTASLSFESTALYTLASAPITATAGTGTVTVTGGSTTKYTLTYNANGGSVSPTSATVNAGSSVTLPTPTKSIKITYNANGGSGAPAAQTAPLTCKGWGKTSSTTTAVANPYTPSGNETLYAIWNSATVTLDTTTKPTKADNTFAGWNTKADGTGTPVSGSYTGKANVTLYAQWTPNATEQCTLTFNAQGGSGAPAAITVDKGATATIPAQKPTKSGYTFIQWNTKADGTGTPYGDGSPVPMSSNLTVYAIWRSNSANPTANAVLNVKASASVEYRADVTIKATATGVPAGYVLAVYDGSTQVAKGDNASVSYHVGNMKAGKTYDVKVVDANGNVQQDGSGNNLSKSCAISVNDGFFAKIIAFFKGLFGALPKITIEP